MTLRLYIYIHIELLMCNTRKFWTLFSAFKVSEQPVHNAAVSHFRILGQAPGWGLFIVFEMLIL